MSGRSNSGEGRLGGEASAGGNVKDAHTGCKMGGAQQKGHEVRRDMRESMVVLRRRLIPEGQFAGHSPLLPVQPAHVIVASHPVVGLT